MFLNLIINSEKMDVTIYQIILSKNKIKNKINVNLKDENLFKVRLK